MSVEAIRSDYHYIKYPYISKSTYFMFFTCKHKFKRIVLDGVAMEESTSMKIGTVLHYMWYKFFDLVDMDLLWDMDYQKDYNTRYSQIYTYFFNLFGGLIPQNVIDNKIVYFRVLRSIRSFCRLQENHWYDLRTHFTNKMDIIKYWRPAKADRECFLRNDELMMYGTIDVIYHEPKVTIIDDYKNRKPPRPLKEEMRKTEYTSANLGKYTAEGAFYGILYLTRMGYRFAYKDDKIEIFLGEKHTPKAIEKIDYAFSFFGEGGQDFPMYYIGRKKLKMISVRTVIKNLELIRNCKEFPAEPSFYKCRWKDYDGRVVYCQFFETECKDMMPDEVYGDIRRSENTPQKSSTELDGSEDRFESLDSSYED